MPTIHTLIAPLRDDDDDNNNNNKNNNNKPERIYNMNVWQ